MVQSNDWRLTGQEKYLKGVTLCHKAYVAPRPGWDHDHCEFCWAKFMENGGPEIQRQGYVTEGDKKWICEACFKDFKEMFGWRVAPAS